MNLACTCILVSRSPVQYDQSGCPTHGPDAPRFFIDHGTIHDRVTGKHVTTNKDDPHEDGINACLTLLNQLAPPSARPAPPWRMPSADERAAYDRASANDDASAADLLVMAKFEVAAALDALPPQGERPDPEHAGCCALRAFAALQRLDRALATQAPGLATEKKG